MASSLRYNVEIEHHFTAGVLRVPCVERKSGEFGAD